MATVTRYMGVYWVRQKEESPGDGTVCVFHRKGNKENNIRFGYYAFGWFYEKIGKNKYQRIDQRHIDYWMAIPVFPDEGMLINGECPLPHCPLLEEPKAGTNSD